MLSCASLVGVSCGKLTGRKVYRHGLQGGDDRRAVKYRAVRVCFDRFTLDTDQRRLFEGDAEIHLAPKAFALLALLIDERPKAISKDDLLQRLWPGTFVTENNLATLISDLRVALHDDPRAPRFLRTVYGFGYSFAADVDSTPAGAPGDTSSSWRLLHEQREIVLRPGVNILGRSGDGVIVVDSATISRHHARISVSGDQAIVEDLSSKNGTWVGTSAVTAPAILNDGDELRLGSVVLTVRFSRSVASTETVSQIRS